MRSVLCTSSREEASSSASAGGGCELLGACVHAARAGCGAAAGATASRCSSARASSLRRCRSASSRWLTMPAASSFASRPASRNTSWLCRSRRELRIASGVRDGTTAASDKHRTGGRRSMQHRSDSRPAGPRGSSSLPALALPRALNPRCLAGGARMHQTVFLPPSLAPPASPPVSQASPRGLTPW